ncbi:hypothetical protein [Collimonas sp. OK412]|jgi:hypothetical protein|nr:hypothetical protein [Collimonas sp. OK412]
MKRNSTQTLGLPAGRAIVGRPAKRRYFSDRRRLPRRLFDV